MSEDGERGREGREGKGKEKGKGKRKGKGKGRKSQSCKLRCSQFHCLTPKTISRQGQILGSLIFFD